MTRNELIAEVDKALTETARRLEEHEAEPMYADGMWRDIEIMLMFTSSLENALSKKIRAEWGCENWDYTM